LAKTPEELLAEAEAKIAEQTAALLAKDAALAEKIVESVQKDEALVTLAADLDAQALVLDAERAAREAAESETKIRDDKQNALNKAEAQVGELRLAVDDANQRIADLEEELQWRRRMVGEHIPEPTVGPPSGPMPELPEWERREQPGAIIPKRKGL
jgi:hypothetical protein